MIVFHLHGLRDCAPAWGRVRTAGRNVPLSHAMLRRAVRRHLLRVRHLRADGGAPNASLGIACVSHRNYAASSAGDPSPVGAVSSSVNSAAGLAGNLLLNGTFDSSLSKYPSKWGNCYSRLGNGTLQFDITDGCDPGQDGLPRSDLGTRNIYGAGVPVCTSVPIRFPHGAPGVTDNTWLMFAETEDPNNPNQNDHAGWGMYVTSYYNGDTTSAPDQFSIAFADYNNFAPAWTSSSNVDNGWHTLSICTNDANDSSGVVYGIWLDGVRQTFNHGPQAGSQQLSGFPIIQNDAANSTSWPLIIDDYTGGGANNTLIHGAPLVAPMGANGVPPQQPNGWNAP